MAGKGGGAWKVAYADFVTAMMAFFLVMWITSQSKPVKEAIAQYFHDPLGTSSRPTGRSTALPDAARHTPGNKGPGQGHERTAAPADAPAAVQDAIDLNAPSVFVLHNGDRRNVGTVILFSEGTADLDDRGRRQLDELLPAVRGKRNKLEVRGHASRRPLPQDSPFQDVWQLCYARSRAVVQHLQSQGIEPERVRLSQAGGFEPYSAETDAAAQARNSRVEVYLLSEFVEDFSGAAARGGNRVAQEEGPNQ